jgi:hypothetical protein
MGQAFDFGISRTHIGPFLLSRPRQLHDGPNPSIPLPPWLNKPEYPLVRGILKGTAKCGPLPDDDFKPDRMAGVLRLKDQYPSLWWEEIER